MCGIFGIVKDKEKNLGEILIGAAERLTYRGYDSVGMATISGGVLAAYAGMMLPYQSEAAGHLIAASIMSAPAATA